MVTASLILEKKKISSSHITNKSLFWNVFDLLKNKNDLDIQNILMISDQTNCVCDNSLCELVLRDIIQNNHFIPYTFMSQSHLKYTPNYTNLFENNLIDEKPSFVIILGTEQRMLQKILHATALLTSKHIWLILHGLKHDGINVKREYELKITYTSHLQQLLFDSKIFLWKGDLAKGYLWEIYRRGAHGSILTKPLLTFKKNYISENNFVYIWERRRNLRGCEIKIAYMNRPPYMYEQSFSFNTKEVSKSQTCFLSGNKTMCGNYVPLLKLILEQLNFTVVWVKAKDGGCGHFDVTSRKWKGLLGLLDSNEAQISPCWHFMTSSKWVDFDFSNPITRYGAHLYMKKPHKTASWSTYYDVFDDT